MTVDVKKLKDEELAAHFRHGAITSAKRTGKTFAATASELGGALSNEYNRRKLNWKQFQR